MNENKAAQPSQPSAPAPQSNKSERIVFSSCPSTLEEFRALEQADLSTPFKTAALTVLALTYFERDKELCYSMLQFISGPREMSPAEKQFINDRFMDGKSYIAKSYFEGATPANDYTPAQPLTVTVSENPYSYDNAGYAKLFIASGGADSPRHVMLRNAKDGKWYLWEQFLLSGIREPESSNPWA
ncbi:MAG: hypothetical protein K6C14_06080 [Eubacterium sp.]|nr:hypothetical protein [Eubacterium sp.]